jgi:hypothetical protein
MSKRLKGKALSRNNNYMLCAMKNIKYYLTSNNIVNSWIGLKREKIIEIFFNSLDIKIYGKPREFLVETYLSKTCPQLQSTDRINSDKLKGQKTQYRYAGDITYNEYIDSKQWKLLREWLFHFRGKKCEKCGKKTYLNVHHVTYDRLYHELPNDLIILCRECHKKEHNLS